MCLPDDTQIYERQYLALQLQIPSPEHIAKNKANTQELPGFDGLN